MPQSGKIKFALVGCGVISKKHIKAISEIPDAEIVAVCDIEPQKAQATGEQLGVQWYNNLQDLRLNKNVDVFSILTPTGDHTQSIMALSASGKPLVVEKPMTLQTEDADRVIKACEKTGSKIFVIKQNRFNPPVVALKSAIDKGRFGKIVMGEVRVWWSRSQSYYDAAAWRGTWNFDGGVLANQAAHHIDMLLWLMGDVEAVSSMQGTQLAKIEAYDTAAAVLRFKSGAIGIISATTATRPSDAEGSVALLGEKGTVEIGGFFMNELLTWKFEENCSGDDNIFEEYGSVPSEPAWNLTRYLEDVIVRLKSNQEPLVDGEFARKTTVIVQALNESAKTNKIITL